MSNRVQRVEFSYPRADLRHVESGVERFKEDHIVWWYNSIRSNTRGKRTIPEVEVMFRRLNNDIPASKPTWATVPLVALPHYRIGTIWREGHCLSDTLMVERMFDVDFSSDKWEITSRAELIDSNRANLFHEDDYPLKFTRDLSTLLNFRLPDGSNLLVPCIEFFVRAYARNMAICKALSTLTFREVKSVFFKCELRDAVRWLIKPTDPMRKADAVFLAHLLYDNYTEHQVKRLISSFVTKGPDTKVFPEVAPWFQGEGQLLCRGRWINQGNTFLCLGLLGSSQPQGREVELFKESFDTTGGEQGGRIVLPQVTRTARAEEFLAEESYILPDAHGEKVILQTPPFETLGPKRAVRNIKSLTNTNRGMRSTTARGRMLFPRRWHGKRQGGRQVRTRFRRGVGVPRFFVRYLECVSLDQARQPRTCLRGQLVCTATLRHIQPTKGHVVQQGWLGLDHARPVVLG